MPQRSRQRSVGALSGRDRLEHQIRTVCVRGFGPPVHGCSPSVTAGRPREQAWSRAGGACAWGARSRPRPSTAHRSLARPGPLSRPPHQPGQGRARRGLRPGGDPLRPPGWPIRPSPTPAPGCRRPAATQRPCSLDPPRQAMSRKRPRRRPAVAREKAPHPFQPHPQLPRLAIPNPAAGQPDTRECDQLLARRPRIRPPARSPGVPPRTQEGRLPRVATTHSLAR